MHTRANTYCPLECNLPACTAAAHTLPAAQVQQLLMQHPQQKAPLLHLRQRRLLLLLLRAPQLLRWV